VLGLDERCARSATWHMERRGRRHSTSFTSRSQRRRSGTSMPTRNRRMPRCLHRLE
jgi:hypothetical protein